MIVPSMVIINCDPKTGEKISSKTFYKEVDDDAYIECLGKKILPILLENGLEGLIADMEQKLHKKVTKPTQNELNKKSKIGR